MGVGCCSRQALITTNSFMYMLMKRIGVRGLTLHEIAVDLMRLIDILYNIVLYAAFGLCVVLLPISIIVLIACGAYLKWKDSTNGI